MSVADIRKKRKQGVSLDNNEQSSTSRVEAIREKRRQGIALDNRPAVNDSFSYVSNSNANLTKRNLPNAKAPERDNKEIYRRAVELAKANNQTSQPKANAGNDRTTALRQNTNPYGLPVYKGLNTAENGADVDQNKFKTEAATQNGWKGLNGTGIAKQIKGNGVTEAESLAHAEDVMSKYKFSDKALSILDEYVAKDDESKRSGLWRFESQGSYSGALMNLGDKFKAETGVSDEEFTRIFESYSRLKHAQERKDQQQEYAEMSNGERVAKSLVKAPKNVLGGYQSLIGSLQNPSDPELGRDYNSEFFRYSNENADIRKAQNDAIDKIEDPTVRTLAHFGYNAGVMGVESATAALTGEAGLGSFFAGGYSSGLKNAEDRGLSPEQSQAYALAVGSLEYFTERIPWEGLRNIWAGKAVSKDAVKGSIMPYIKALLKQSGSEATEEVINGIGETIADGLIAGDKSNINIAIQNYIQNDSLSEEEATSKAIWDVVKETADAAVTAAISAGVSAGPALANQAYTVTKAGKNIVKNAAAMSDENSPYYIPDTRDSYVADEDYEQALNTREAINDANNGRVSGKQARAIYESVAETEGNLSTAQKVEATKLIEGYKAKAEEKAIEQIKEASTPAEVETIKEENINSEAVKAAVEEKKAEMIEAGEATEKDFTEAITPTKAVAMAQKGEAIAPEVLEQLPEKVKQAYETGNANQANKLTSDASKIDIISVKFTNKEGETIQSEIKSVSQNNSGELVLELSNGETVKAAEAEFTDKGKYIYNSPNGINSLDNPVLAQIAFDIEKNSKHGVAIGYVTNTLKDMYTIGASGLDFEQAIKSKKYDVSTLGKENLRAAYEEGKKHSNATSRATAAKRGKGLIREATEENAADYKSQFADEATRNEYENQLSEANKSFLELFSKKIGVDIAFFNENSQDRGSYRPDEGKIYLNLYHSHNMFNVALHEGIGEFMAASNEKAYNAIVDSVLNAYAGTNSTKLAKDIRAYQAAYEGDTYGGTYRGAAQELFNDALSDMFSSEENMKKLYNWMLENEGEKQANKVKKTLADYFKSVAETIKEVITEGRLSKAEVKQLRISEKEANTYVDQILRAMDQAIANRDAGSVQQTSTVGRNALDLRLDEWKNVNVYGMPVAFKGAKIKTTDNISLKELYQLQEDFIHNFSEHQFQKHDYLVSKNHVARIFSVTNKEQFKISEIESKEDFIERIVYGEIYKYRTADGREDYKIPDRLIIELWNDEQLHRWNSELLKKFGAKSNVARVLQYVEKKTSSTNKGNDSASSRSNTASRNNGSGIEDIARHSFAGIGAETADMHQLNIASDMMDDGIDEETILASTGWFKGLDNKWKFEIPDNDLVIFKDGNAEFLYGNPDFKRYNELMDKIFFKGDVYTDEEFEELGELEEKVLLKTQEYGNLSDFIKHDKLFDAYPFLYGTYVDFVDFGDASIKGAADIKNNGIHLNEQFHKSVSGSYSSDAMKSVLLHEIQHLIQQYEDFANGSSPTWWNDIKEERIEADEKNLAAAKEYLDRAIADARERGLPTSVEDYIFELSEQLDSNKLTPEEYRKEIAKFKKSKVYHYSDMVRKLERHLRRLRNDSNELLYWNTAGEIEARDVQNRMSLTEQERREKLPKNYDSDVVYTDGSTAQRRYSIKVDTEGRSLSEGQQEYFKDSNVVDDNGNLMVVYHGSPNEFTEFKHEFIGTTGAAEGKGFYFTNNKSMAEGYSREDRGQILKGYLNITKPLSLEEITLTKSELKKFLMAVDPTGDEILSDYDSMGGEGYPSKAWYNRALNDTINAMMQFNENDADIAAEIFNMLDKDGLLQFKNILGYDGFIARDKYPDAEVYVAFDSNQFKNTDNLNPTDNPDIRKSIKVDDQGREIAPKMAEYLKDNADVFFDENGAVKNYYHGTRYAGFTQFSLSMMDDKQSIFLTDNKGTANTYAGNHDLFEPDKEWTYNQLENAISYMTGGDWEVEQDGDTITIIEYGFGDKEDKETQFDSVLAAQTYFIDNYLNKIDLKSDENAAIYNLYVKSSNPLVIDANGDNWDQIIPKKYFRHFIDVNISKSDEQYSAEWADERGVYYNHTFDSKEKLEELLAKLPEDVPQEGLYFENLYIDENRDIIPSNTRTMAKYAKENGYDSLVVNNVVDTGIFGNNEEKLTPSQVVVVFNPNQVKSVHNTNPAASEDIRYSISVGEDRIYNYRGTEIVQNPSNREYQQMRADIIKERPWMDGPDTILLRHTYDEEGNTYYWDAYAGMHRDIEPAIAEHWKTRVNQQWEWWKDDDKDFWANRSFSRYSKAVFGEESQYSDRLEQTQFVSQILSTLNNQLKGTTVSMKYIDETVKYILDKYDADLNPDDFKMELSQFIAYMTANEQVDYNQMMNYLLNVGDEVIQASRLKDPEEERIYSELKKELSSHKINLTEAERKELISKYGGSWNAVFGKLNAAGIKLNNAGQHMDGSTYSEIVEKFREIAGVQLDEEKTAVDQIATILDAMDALKPSAYQWEGATDMDKALDVATTIIDRYYSMATAIKESNIVKGTEKGAAAVERAKKNEIKKLRAKQEEYKAKINEEFQQLVEDRKKVIQEQQEFYKRQAEIEKNFRGEKREFNKKANMTSKELEKTARLQAQVAYQGLKDTEAKKKNKDNIVRTCMRLINWMNKPTDTRHVPTFLKPALTDMIKSINFMPASMRKGDDGTISAIKWQESMRKLQQVLQGISNADAESLNDSDKYELSLVMEVDEIVNKMQQLLDKYNGTADISRMRPEDLKTLSDIMTSISKGISQMNENFMNRRFKHVSEAAKASINEMNELKPISNTMGTVKSTLSDFLNLDMAEPITFFEELGSASESIMQEFFDGEKIGIEIIKEADNFFDKISKDLGLTTKDLRAWENDAKEYKFGGVPITLTSADLMSLYCSYNREKLDQEERPFDATHHIAAGGIKGFRHRIGFKEVNRNPQVAHVNEAEVLRLLDNLTETQKKYADLVVGYMSTTLAEHGNKTSNKLNGYSKFLGKYYFPLKTDNNAIATTESNNTSDQAAFRRLIFPSFTKSQIDKADNALVIMNFFDVVTEHITGMSNYCAYAMPISDAMRWYNYAETERANTEVENQYQRYTTSVKGSMDRVRGDEARKYFENFIRDVNLDNKPSGSKASRLIAQGLTGLAKAKAVGLNIRVILQQPCAIIRAADVIEGKYLAEGWAKMSKNPKAATEYAQSNSYLCYWKSKGFSDTRVSQSMKEIITGQESLRQDIVEKTGFLAGWADDIAWASMYYAAEEKIKATTDFEEGSEEFNTAVEELFSDIINHTQVIDSQLRKTGTMRSKSELEILANAFKKEPQKSYNMLHRAYWKVYQNPTSAEAKKGWQRAVTIFAENAFITAIAQSLVDAWRDDDEEDSYLMKMLKKMLPYDSYATVKDFVTKIMNGEVKAKDVLGLIQGIYGGAGNILDNANIASSIPYVADVDSLLKGYSVTRLDSTSILTQLKNTVTTLGSTNATPYSIIYSLAQLVGYGTGIGVDNALRDLRGIYNQFISDITGVRIEKNAATAKKNAKKKETNRVSDVFDSNNLSSIKAEIQTAYDRGVESSKNGSESDGWSAARNMLKEQYQRILAEHPEEQASLNNRFKSLLKYTKKSNGKGGYRPLTDKEIQNYIDNWSAAE